MISFHPAAWDDGLREWLYADPDLVDDAAMVETEVKAGRSAVMVAADGEGGAVGLLVASTYDGRYLMIEAVSGGPTVMRAAIQWSKEMVRLLGLEGAMAYTRKPGVVYHMTRAGARMDGTYLWWEV